MMQGTTELKCHNHFVRAIVYAVRVTTIGSLINSLKVVKCKRV